MRSYLTHSKTNIIIQLQHHMVLYVNIIILAGIFCIFPQSFAPIFLLFESLLLDSINLDIMSIIWHNDPLYSDWHNSQPVHVQVTVIYGPLDVSCCMVRPLSTLS